MHMRTSRLSAHRLILHLLPPSCHSMPHILEKSPPTAVAMYVRGIEIMRLRDLALEALIPVPERQVDVALSTMQPAGTNRTGIRFSHSLSLCLTPYSTPNLRLPISDHLTVTYYISCVQGIKRKDRKNIDEPCFLDCHNTGDYVVLEICL